MNESEVNLNKFSDLFGYVIKICKEIDKKGVRNSDDLYVSLTRNIELFKKLLIKERRESLSKSTKHNKELKDLMSLEKNEEVNSKIKILEQMISQDLIWKKLLSQAESLVYYNTGKVLFFKDKGLALKYLKKVKEEYEESYGAKLIINLANKDMLDFCESIGFHEDFLKVLHYSFVYKANSFRDLSLHRDLSQMRAKKDKVILYLINFFVFRILDKLIVKFDENERKVAHYTSLLGFEKMISENSYLRLNSADLMNDPSEGKLIFPYLNVSNYTEDSTFLSCFTFNHNSLNQFRLYGRTDNREGTGISLVVNEDYFSRSANGFILNELIGVDNVNKKKEEDFNVGLPLFRCVYIDNRSGYIDVAKRSKQSFYQEYASEMTKSKINEKWMEYEKLIKNINDTVSKDLEKLKEIIAHLNLKKAKIEKLVQRSLRPLRFVFKHMAFHEEQECRIFYVTNLYDKKVIIPNGEQKVIYEYDKEIKDYLTNVYIGPALSDKMTYVSKTLVGKDVVIKVCDSPFSVG